MFSLFLDSAQQDPHADTTDVTDEAEATLVLHRARSFNKLRQGAWSMGGVKTLRSLRSLAKIRCKTARGVKKSPEERVSATSPQAGDDAQEGGLDMQEGPSTPPGVWSKGKGLPTTTPKRSSAQVHHPNAKSPPLIALPSPAICSSQQPAVQEKQEEESDDEARSWWACSRERRSACSIDTPRESLGEGRERADPRTPQAGVVEGAWARSTEEEMARRGGDILSIFVPSPIPGTPKSSKIARSAGLSRALAARRSAASG